MRKKGNRKGMPKKATNRTVNVDYLRYRAEWLAERGFPKSKWISFCEEMISHGLSISLYEARATRSKYVTVSDGQKAYKVRFSNHRPIRAREVAGDCDFFVGVTHLGTTTTAQAQKATLDHFGLMDAEVSA